MSIRPFCHAVSQAVASTKFEMIDTKEYPDVTVWVFLWLVYRNNGDVGSA